jgi:hypothetical protein
VGRSTGATPGPDGAPYAVNFRAATPISWQYLHLRVLTTAPPTVVNGALTQGASLADGVATYFERQSPQLVRRMRVQAGFPPRATSRTSIPRWG